MVVSTTIDCQTHFQWNSKSKFFLGLALQIQFNTNTSYTQPREISSWFVEFERVSLPLAKEKSTSLWKRWTGRFSKAIHAGTTEGSIEKWKFDHHLKILIGISWKLSCPLTHILMKSSSRSNCKRAWRGSSHSIMKFPFKSSLWKYLHSDSIEGIP